MLESMTSLTGGGGLQGGAAAPSTVTNTTNTTNTSGFNSGSINFGSNNGLPEWVFAVGAIAAAYYVFKSKK